MRARLASFLVALSLAAPADRPASAMSAPGPRTGFHRAAPYIDNDDHMDVNTLDMFVTNHGSIAYDLVHGNGGLIYPKGSGKTALFAAGVWIGAKVNGAVRVATGEYGQEYTPGPMAGGTFQTDRAGFHNFAFDATHPLSADSLAEYAAQGGPLDGSYNPLLFGDATIWSVFNDADPAVHTNNSGSTTPLGVEVQQTVCAYNAIGALGRTIFVKWRVTQKGADALDSAYISIWCDPDLGGATDDLVGCDTTVALGYCYNATNADALYGSTPPAVGIALLRGAVVSPSPGVYDTLGMTSFVKYVGGTDPASASEAYALMRGLHRDGTRMHVLEDALQPVTTFGVSGMDLLSASSPTNWIDSGPGDRLMMLSTGPFSLAPGESQEVIFAICVGQGANRLTSVTALRDMIPLIRPFAPPAAPPATVASMSVEVALDPPTLDLSSRAPWVIATIEPFGVNPDAIDVSSVLLAGVPPDPDFAEIADHDGDGRPDLRLRFPRAGLDPRFVPGAVTLPLTGWLRNGDSFAGTGALRVIDARHTMLAASLAPNPMNPAGTLRFATTRVGAVQVSLFDARGRRVRRLLIERALASGAHEISVDGRDDHGAPLGSGLYWFRIDAAEGTATGRLVLLK